MSFTLFFASGRVARDPAGVNDCEMEGNGRSGRDVGNNDARFGSGREFVGEEGEARGEEMVGNVRVATDKDMVAIVCSDCGKGFARGSKENDAVVAG